MIQKRALRAIYPGLHYDDMLTLLGLKSLKDRRDALCKTYFKRLLGNNHRLNQLIPAQRVVDVVHATRQVCCPAEKTAGKKTTRLKKHCVTFMQTRDMYLHFTRSNVWANGNRYNFSSRVKTR